MRHLIFLLLATPLLQAEPSSVLAKIGEIEVSGVEIRENIAVAERAHGKALKHDVAVPVSRVSEFMERGAQLASSIAPGVDIIAFGHVGDGNIHFNVTPPPGQEPKCIMILNAITINRTFQMTVLNINILSGLYSIFRILNLIAQNGWCIMKNLKYQAQLIWCLKIPMVQFKYMIGNAVKKFNTKRRSVNMQ